jgi:hypothetical protein
MRSIFSIKGCGTRTVFLFFQDAVKFSNGWKQRNPHLQLPHSFLTWTLWQLSRTIHPVDKPLESSKVCWVCHEFWTKSHVGEVRYVVGKCDPDNPVIRVFIRHFRSILTSSRGTLKLGRSQHLHTIIWTSTISKTCHQQVNTPEIVFIPFPRLAWEIEAALFLVVCSWRLGQPNWVPHVLRCNFMLVLAQVQLFVFWAAHFLWFTNEVARY